MKTVVLLVVAAMMSVPAAHALLPPTELNRGAAIFKLTASVQNQYSDPVRVTTNHMSADTRIITTYKSSVTNFTIDSDFMLRLMENSFDTNFPAGAKLVLSREINEPFFFVVDSTGTNILLDLATNLVLERVSAAPSSITGTTTTIESTSDPLFLAGNITESATRLVVLRYDDSGLTTRDHTHSKFEVNGVLVEKFSVNLTTFALGDAIRFEGAGFGKIRNLPYLLQGGVTAAIKGAY